MTNKSSFDIYIYICFILSPSFLSIDVLPMLVHWASCRSKVDTTIKKMGYIKWSLGLTLKVALSFKIPLNSTNRTMFVHVPGLVQSFSSNLLPNLQNGIRDSGCPEHPLPEGTYGAKEKAGSQLFLFCLLKGIHGETQSIVAWV